MDTNGTSGPPLNHNQAVSSSSSAAPNGQPLPPTLRMNSYRGGPAQNLLASHNIQQLHSANGVAATYMHVNEAQPTNYVSAEYYSHPTAPVAGGSSGGAQQTIANHINHARPRKLQVDDALSYLEQVRQQFADNPDVYNHFLEVMKEFKSHTIDTQGVIRRVSRLFSGNPNLITGFNTFLPPGYEVRVSGAGILIIEPNGINTTVDSVSGEPIRVTSQSTTGPPPPETEATAVVQPAPIKSEPVNQAYPLAGGATEETEQPFTATTFSTTNNLLCSEPMQFTQDLKQFTDFSNKNMTQADVNAEAGGVTQQPIHFDQAVGYLNKIKERFSQRPEIYREFLNILGNYQRITNEPEADRSQMNETEVYRAVSQLFRDEEDLMLDFKSFLPDAGLESSDKSQQHQSHSTPPTDKTAISDINTNKTSSGLPVKKSSNAGQAAGGGTNAPHPKKPKLVTKVGYDMSVPECLEDIPLKDFVFFEKIHKALKNESLVKNFFRCLLLYNKSLVSRVELVDMINPFLAEFPDLLKQFHEILGMSTMMRSPNKLDKVENRLTNELASQIDYSTCKRLGVSYRSLPDSYERTACSGRTKLCNAVLNDTWVSFPSWSSEDTSSVSSKKSQFEDFMYRTEDERFEVDILIEVNSAAITSLESIRRKIEAMSVEDARNFTLDTNYGCISPTLMARAVKKLYGEHATKVLEGLRENPVIAVAQVLKRLREKDAEWRSIREEFNLIWRDQIDKNYLKSLDHQAISFKANDLKFLRSKAIIQQLETIYDERQARMEKGGPIENGPHMVLEYPADKSVIHDANELLIHYVKRQQNIPKKEKFIIKKHLRCLIPRLFNLELEVMSDDDEENEGSDKSDTESGQLITRRTKKVLRAKKQSAKSSEVPLNREAVGGSGYTLFFSSNSWLIFIRLHHIICERLACLKKRSEELIKEYEFEKQIRERQEKIYQAHGKAVASHPDNAVDVHLGLRDLKKPLQNPETFYPILIQELKNVLDGIIDGSAFEDNIRNMFGTTAYLMFTMDKLITTLTRQMQNFVTDQASVSSVSLFYKYCAHRAASLDPKQAFQVDEFYETAAEKVITNQNCFKMFFLHLSSPTLAVELIDTDTDLDTSSDTSPTSVSLAKWNEFLEKYIGDEDNSSEIIPSNLFLLRNMISRKLKTEVTFDFFSQSDLSDTPSFYINEGLRAVLSTENVKNLKLLYERGSSDILVKKGAPGDAKKTQQELSERRSQRFHDWLRHKKSADPDLSSDDYLFE